MEGKGKWNHAKTTFLLNSIWLYYYAYYKMAHGLLDFMFSSVVTDTFPLGWFKVSPFDGVIYYYGSFRFLYHLYLKYKSDQKINLAGGLLVTGRSSSFTFSLWSRGRRVAPASNNSVDLSPDIKPRYKQPAVKINRNRRLPLINLLPFFSTETDRCGSSHEDLTSLHSHGDWLARKL